jgi:hypothetical protein
MILWSILQRRKDKKEQKRAKLVEESLRRIDNLKSLDIGTKSILHKYVEKYIPELIKADRHLKRANNVSIFLFFFYLFIEFVLYSFILKNHDIVSLDPLNRIIFNIPIILLQIIILVLFSFLFIIIGLYVLLYIPFIIVVRYIHSQEVRMFKEHALDYIIDELIAILIVVEDNTEDRNTVYFKQELLKKIERIAQLFEHFLPLKFLTLDFEESMRLHSQEMDQMRRGKMTLSVNINDNVTDLWLKERMEQVAAALREKKKWILMPKCQ